ncbi:unnamed protein product [Symbiodinium necroappetens]|uniref:Uncharacterized protein n=1 Tax=Symbiodinium necroappetens TaxID=1628268 RepID=A0A813BFT5_9DINO|nr:unnamed protein product [Symbiodinium necroappetens]
MRRKSVKPWRHWRPRIRRQGMPGDTSSTFASCRKSLKNWRKTSPTTTPVCRRPRRLLPAIARMRGGTGSLDHKMATTPPVLRRTRRAC